MVATRDSVILRPQLRVLNQLGTLRSKTATSTKTSLQNVISTVVCLSRLIYLVRFVQCGQNNLIINLYERFQSKNRGQSFSFVVVVVFKTSHLVISRRCCAEYRKSMC